MKKTIKKEVNVKPLIIIAEDDPVYISVFKNKLSKEGYIVKIASDGQKLMNLLKTTRPDLLLLDLIMPIMDGFEVLQNMKADAKLKNIKVIVTSNLGQKEDKEKAAKLGAVDYFVKSDISIYEMVAKINKWL